MSGKKKASPFWLFVKENMKKCEIKDEKAGRSGDDKKEGRLDYSKIVEAVGEQWEKMSLEERKPYVERAKKYNGSKCSEHGGKDSFGRRLDAIHIERLAEQCRIKEKDAYLREIYQSYALRRQIGEMPIVLCKFNTYWKFSTMGKTHVVPSEVALSAFNIKDGVFDNLCTLIDPGDFLREEHHSYVVMDEAHRSSKMQHIFLNNYAVELQNYEKILQNVCNFLNEHVGAKVVFCHPEDIDVTEACFEWLCARTGMDHSDFEILNLSSMMKLVSIQGYADKKEAQHGEKGNPQEDLALKKAWDQKKKNAGAVVYPWEYPSIKSKGLFLAESHVDALLMRSNYAYYDELACTYHMEISENSHLCPLNLVNRYAFALLDALLPNFSGVIPRLGDHYPRTKDLEREAFLRRKMLIKWTDFRFIRCAQDYMKAEPKKEQKKSF